MSSDFGTIGSPVPLVPWFIWSETLWTINADNTLVLPRDPTRVLAQFQPTQSVNMWVATRPMASDEAGWPVTFTAVPLKFTFREHGAMVGSEFYVSVNMIGRRIMVLSVSWRPPGA